MLQFVCGTAGSGRTAYVRRQAAALAREGKRTAILVPEQFSFETERAMLMCLSPAEADRVEVFSFTKLAARLAREAGGLAGRRLDECGRAAVMNVALSSVRDHLVLYAGRRGQDLVAGLLAAVGEFKSCAISPELLDETAKEMEESVLSQKLTELSLIYGAYNALISQIGSLDPLDDLTRLAANLDEIAYFDGMTVFADSFTGFTRQECSVVEKIIRQCDTFVMTLCGDESLRRRQSDRLSLFGDVQRTAAQLNAMAEEAEWIFLPPHARFESEALKWMEAGVFRAGQTEVYPEATVDVNIYAAADKYDEAEFAAREIRRLIREKGWRRRDFALICRTASDYQEPLLRALAMQGIPCFCDKRIPVTDLPVVRFVLAGLDIAAGRWRTEDILRWLKTGMVDGVSVVDVARLENYCFIWDIRGAHWRQPFTQSPYGCTDREPEDSGTLLAQINAVRERVEGLLSPFIEVMKSDEATGREKAAAVWRLLDEAGAAACIERMLPRLSPTDADAQGQVWNALMNILDQLAEILGDSPAGLREFAELLTLMVGLCDIGRIPQGLDEAVFGAADRIRTAAPKAVFVLGANDGIFPLVPTSGGVFTDSERRLLIERQLPLSGDMDDSAVSEQYLAYAAMTCASKRVYVTYGKADGGEGMYPSEIVTELRRIVPGCREWRTHENVTLADIESEEAGFLLAAGCTSQEDEISRALTECYRRRPAYADRLAVVEAARQPVRRVLRDTDTACALFGRNLRVSASKAECFYQCRFEYFCRYGMKALPPRRAALDPLEYGSVVHYVLEQLLRHDDASSLATLAQNGQLTDRIRPYLETYLDDVMGGSEKKSARFLYLFHRLADTLTALAVQLGEEFAKSLFVPEAFEMPIGGEEIKPLKLTLADGTTLTVDGKIDRVDLFTKDGVRYVRVVDYKTGSKEFVLSDILAGLNMQMLIYLDILCDPSLSGKDYAPAGVVYSPASLRKAAGVRGETTFDGARQEMLRKNGLIMDNDDVIDAMEVGMERKIDKKENVSIKGATTFRSSATYVADAAQFERIRDYIRSLLREMGLALHQGDIEALPVKGTYDACAYCDYRALCSQECKNGGREIRKRSMSEVMETLADEEAVRN
ncbi:MAG: PD-(D/E)XK nuclease family protein [Clostridia bacterium]|nr:PD-(D/E)XK nuclease family protein [Clostridia bacterium]